MTEDEKREFKEAVKMAIAEAIKDGVKEAHTEWLNDQFAAFGKWTFLGLGAAAFIYLLKLFGVERVWH